MENKIFKVMVMYEDILTEAINEFWKIGMPDDLIERDIFSLSELFVSPRKVIVITGLRRVGKTYVIFQLIKQLLGEIPRERIYYLNFEDERIPREKEVLSAFTSIMRAKLENLSNALIFLDEIHKIPEWSRWLFRVYEREKPVIVVTGSSSELSAWNLPRELRGRALTYRLFPLRFREFIRFKHGEEQLVLDEWSRVRVLQLLDEYLRYGGMPEVVLSPVQRKLRILQDYYWTIITRDIAESQGIENLSILNTVLKYVTNTVYFSASRLHNILKSAGYRIGKNTILDYVSYAEKAYFITQLPQYHERASQKIIAPRKIYLGDVGFLTALATKKIVKGRLFENLVFLELQRRYYHDPTIEISYLSLKDGEVDFVVSRGLDILELVQVCYDPTDIETKQREVLSLVKALRAFRIKRGIIITANYEDREVYGTREITYIPYIKWECRIGELDPHRNNPYSIP